MSFSEKIAYYGVFTALAIALCFAERFIPQPFAFPGIKLGLANIVVLVTLYRFNGKFAFGISVLRIIITGLLFGGPFAIIYSLAGGTLSFAVMYYAKKSNIFGIIGVSVLGGVAHNLGQIIIACFIVENIGLLYYTPILIISGLITGVITGTATYFTRIGLKQIRPGTYES